MLNLFRQIPLSERPTARKYFLWQHGSDKLTSQQTWDMYKAYLDRTSVLLPLPPALYRTVPSWIKQTILLEWPMFRFHEEEDGQKALAEQR